MYGDFLNFDRLKLLHLLICQPKACRNTSEWGYLHRVESFVRKSRLWWRHCESTIQPIFHVITSALKQFHVSYTENNIISKISMIFRQFANVTGCVWIFERTQSGALCALLDFWPIWNFLLTEINKQIKFVLRMRVTTIACQKIDRQENRNNSRQKLT